jgi:hypothetical protein
MNLTSTNDALSSIGEFSRDLNFLPKLNEFNFENFLRIYKNTNNQYFYNILSNTVTINGDLDQSVFYEITVRKSIPWTTLSYNEYRTMHLWWLIMEVNKITSPLDYPAPGTKLKILYPRYVKTVIDEIYNQTMGVNNNNVTI